MFAIASRLVYLARAVGRGLVSDWIKCQKKNFQQRSLRRAGPFDYGLGTVVSVLFSYTRTRLLNEREIFNTARSEAVCSIENFEFIIQ